MATTIEFGSICLDGKPVRPGSEYNQGACISIASGDAIKWVVSNGILIADRCILVNLSWDDLNKQNLVYGKNITIGGRAFQIRLLKVGKRGRYINEWLAAMNTVCDSDCIWHWDGSFFWGQNEYYKDPACRAICGYYTAYHCNWSESSNRAPDCGFRPALVPLPDSDPQPGNTICIIRGQSVIYGELLEQTDYDLIIKPLSKTILTKKDERELLFKCSNGRWAIDRSNIVTQVIS